MDEHLFNQTVERLKEVNSIIAELDQAIRAEAFAILRPYIEGKQTRVALDGTQDSGSGGQQDVDMSSAEAFVRSQTIDKPGQVVVAIAAWWFSQYGSAPIKREDIERIAHEIGLTVSGRPDNTLRALKRDGKSIYRVAGRGALAPTIPHGELFFQNEYGVTKGRNTPPSPDE
jgi:hypothetical protein